jgi:hypothetical protein
VSNASLQTAGILLIVVPTIQYGGYSLLRFLIKEIPGYLDNPVRRGLFTAGHAHAGVLVILGLLVMQLMQLNDVPGIWQTLSSGVLIAAILMPAGFFLSVLGRDPQQPSKLIILLWAGAASLVVGLGAAGLGLIVAGTS